MSWARPLPLVLVALLFIAPVAAQDAGPVQITGAPEQLFIHGGGSEILTYTVSAADATQAYHIEPRVELPVDGNWQATVTPRSATLQPDDEREFRVTVSADRLPVPRSFDLSFEVFAVGQDFDSRVVEATTVVQATGTDAILGRWENPLPAPLDGDWGAFGLNLAIWWLIGLATMWLISPTLKLLTLRTKSDLDDKVIKIISRPAFILVFTFGLVRSLEVFALPVVVFQILQRMWTIVVAFAIVYIAYKLWHAVVLAIGRRVARRTESELDDRLYPVLEKVGGVIILVVGVFYILGSFGVDLTLFAAGGAIGGLVIAFAAQDTLANFFAGVFILLDRPFRVGDRIELPEQQHWGDVQRIGLRTTSVRTQDNRMVIFPNNYIGANPIVNHSYPDPFYRIQVDFKLPYGSDVEFVRKTLVEAVKPVEGVNPDRAPEALLLEFTEHGQGWRLRWWINSYADTRRAFDRVNSQVIKAMVKAGIRIQYQPLTIWDAHKLLERDSRGGLEPTQLTETQRAQLEHEHEAERKKAEVQERAQVEQIKQEERRKAENAKEKRDDESVEAGGDGAGEDTAGGSADGPDEPDTVAGQADDLRKEKADQERSRKQRDRDEGQRG